MRMTAMASMLALMLAGCGGDGAGGGTTAASPTGGATPTPTPSPVSTASPAPTPTPTDVTVVTEAPVASFDNPWAMVFLPDGRLLVTEKPGRLQLVTQAGVKTQVGGVPAVTYGGQLGLQDVVLAPDYATTGRIYLS